MWAIVDTACFIPIFSDDYYSKNHCRNEMDCAMKRGIEKLLTIKGIALSMKAVPEAFAAYNCLDVSQTPGFMKAIEAELSNQYAVAPSEALIPEGVQLVANQDGAAFSEKSKFEPLVAAESNHVGDGILMERQSGALSKEQNTSKTTLIMGEKGPDSLSKDRFLLKHYCLERAIEVYKYNQSMAVVELAEQFERYLKSQENGNESVS